MRLFDAHNHLQDARLRPHAAGIAAVLREVGLYRAVVNGTRESDWDDVATLAAANPSVLPAYGLHPWHLSKRTPVWRSRLIERLDADPRASVGETGLDRWMEGHDLDLQREVFTEHLKIAAERNRPVTVHCLKAWGALWEILRSHPLPARGVLLHSYGGPVEMVAAFVTRGAYFSFSPYFLHPRKAAQREAFRAVPFERLLVETDAPDMRPPDDRNPRPLLDLDGQPINHPANIAVAYEGLAEIRAVAVEELAACVEGNFVRLFGG